MQTKTSVVNSPFGSGMVKLQCAKVNVVKYSQLLAR